MKLIKEKKGFTLVELVVVIAILGILAGIAIPRFMEATKSARGAKIVADMRTIESAVNVYYVKYGAYPATDQDATGTDFAKLVNGGTWPVPPTGAFSIASTAKAGNFVTGDVADGDTYEYAYTAATTGTTGTTATDEVYKVTLKLKTADSAGDTAPTVSELLGN